MYTFIHLVVLVLLTVYAFLILISKPSYVKLSKTEKILLTGREKFLLFTLVTGMFAVGSFSSLRLFIWILIILFSFVLYKKLILLNRLTIFYVLFLGWLLFELIVSQDVLYGLRVYLKYLYPYLILLFAFTFVHSKEFIFIALRWMLISSFIASLFLGGVMTKILGIWFFNFGGLFWPISTLADYLSVMSAVAFVMWWRTKEKKYLIFIVWFMLSSILQTTRTGILSIGIMLIVASYLRYKFFSVPYIIAAFFLAISIILFVPQVKEKMFYEPEKIQTYSDIVQAQEDNNLNTSRRSQIWEYLLKYFYVDKELIGSGLGSVQQYMYENSILFGGLDVPHSDYVQILCDTGKIGLLFYLMFPLSIYFFMIRFVHKRPTSSITTSAVLAFLSYSAILPAMAFDNVVNYAFAAHSYPFIFVGIFLAYRRQERMKRNIHV